MKTRIEELRDQLSVQNKGLHYLKQTHETECVEQLCAEIDILRSKQSEMRGLLKETNTILKQVSSELVSVKDGPIGIFLSESYRIQDKNCTFLAKQ